jgi:hypothetical protein
MTPVVLSNNNNDIIRIRQGNQSAQFVNWTLIPTSLSICNGMVPYPLWIRAPCQLTWSSGQHVT